MENIGILVFTNQKVLEHKKRDGKLSEGNYCYWKTSRFPKRFLENPNAEKRIYFAVKGQVKGYFIIHSCEEGELQFFSESWTEIKNGEKLKPSWGWRYYGE